MHSVTASEVSPSNCFRKMQPHYSSNLQAISLLLCISKQILILLNERLNYLTGKKVFLILMWYLDFCFNETIMNIFENSIPRNNHL